MSHLPHTIITILSNRVPLIDASIIMGSDKLDNQRGIKGGRLLGYNFKLLYPIFN
jgi:hypothetical protein